MRKKNIATYRRRQKQFWKKTVAIALSTALGASHLMAPMSALAFEPERYEEFSLPEGVSLADFGDAINLYYNEARITDPALLEEIFALRNSLVEELALSLQGQVGAVGFEDEFSLDDPDALINISVQFVTPPTEALQILAEEGDGLLPNLTAEGMAALNALLFEDGAPSTEEEFEAIALEAHENFAEQLAELEVPLPQVEQPQILSYHYTLFNGVFMTVPQRLVEDIAALPEVFVVTPEQTFYSISDLENPIINDEGAMGEIWLDENEEAALWPSLYYSPEISPSDYFMREALEVLGIADIVADRGLTGQNIRVGVLDTGIDYYHPLFYTSRYDLNGTVSHRGWDFVSNRRSPMEARPGEVPPWGGSEVGPSTHGTHVAGSVVAVAPGITLYHYRVLFGSTPGHIISQGIERAFNDNVDIMNLSLGAPVNVPFAPDAYMLNLASLSGIVVVIAAGNSGSHVAGSLGTPGVASLPITVGNAQLGGLAQNFLEDGAVVDGQSIFMELRGNQFMFEMADMSDELAYVNLGQLSGLPENPTAEFVADFREDVLGGTDLTDRVAVVFRGGTTFASMRALVQALNASAMILVDNQPAANSNSLANISTPLDGIGGANRIPFFATSQSYGTLFEAAGTVSFSDVVSVELTDNMNPSSSRGPVSVSYHISPDVVAPGTRIVSAVPSFAVSPNPADWNNWRYAYNTYSGTSMAAPAVTGIVALMLEAMPELAPWEIKARLMATARPLEGTPSAAVQATNGGAFYSVLNVGAGFVRPSMALEANVPFATVMNDIPWLREGVPAWSTQLESALNFGDMMWTESEPLTVEIHNAGESVWSYLLHWNGSDEGAELVELDRTNNTFTFQLVLAENAPYRFFEGNLVFTDGVSQVTVPFGGNNSRQDFVPMYVDPAHLGIVRPVISGFVREYAGQYDPRLEQSNVIGELTSSNVSGSVFNIQNPNATASYQVPGVVGPSVGTVFLAVRYDEDGNVEEEFVLGGFNVPTNANFHLPDFVLARMGGELLPEGVYTFYADVLDVRFPFREEIGQFVVTNQRPEIHFDEDEFRFELNGQVTVSGHIYSAGHELALAHGVRSAAYHYSAGPNAGQQVVFDYRFTWWSAQFLGNISNQVLSDGRFEITFTPTPMMVLQATHEPLEIQTLLYDALGLSFLTNPISNTATHRSEVASFAIMADGVPEPGRFEIPEDFDGVVQFNYDWREGNFTELELPNPVFLPIPTIYVDFGEVLEQMTGTFGPFNQTIVIGLTTPNFPGMLWSESYPLAALGIDLNDESTWRFGYRIGFRGPSNSVGMSRYFDGDWTFRFAVGGPAGQLFLAESEPIALNVEPLPTGGVAFDYTYWPEVYYIVQGEQANLNIGFDSIPDNVEEVAFWWRRNGQLMSAFDANQRFFSHEASGAVTLSQPLQAGHNPNWQAVGTWQLMAWVRVDGQWSFADISEPVEIRNGVGDAVWRDVPEEAPGEAVTYVSNEAEFLAALASDSETITFAENALVELTTDVAINRNVLIDGNGGRLEGRNLTISADVELARVVVVADITVTEGSVLTIEQGAQVGNMPGPANAPVIVSEDATLNLGGIIARAVTINGALNVLPTGSIIAGGGAVNVAFFTASGEYAVVNVYGTIARRIEVLNGATFNLQEGGSINGNPQFNVRTGAVVNLRGTVNRTVVVYEGSEINLFETGRIIAGSSGVQLGGPNITFNMFGGEIQTGWESMSGVEIWTNHNMTDFSYGTVFNMYDGLIAVRPGTGGNVPVTTGNGVGLTGRGAVFNFHGGEIRGHANRGVFSNSYGVEMNMTGGMIYGAGGLSPSIAAAGNGGGAISLMGANSVLNITGGYLINNSAENGGAINMADFSNLTIGEEVVFHGNVAREGLRVNDLLAQQFADAIAPAAVSYGNHAFNNHDIFVFEEYLIGDEPQAPAYPTWDSGTAFNTGDRIIYNGRVFETQWWTQNEVPGSTPWGSWMEIGNYSYMADFGYVTTWTASRVFDTGALVYYDGSVFRAQWWTRNQSPSTQWGPWQALNQ